MEFGGRDAAIVQAIIDLGHELGLRIVAEGVESHAVLVQLCRAKADVAQGMHICEPLPPDRLLAWLRSRPGSRRIKLVAGRASNVA